MIRRPEMAHVDVHTVDVVHLCRVLRREPDVLRQQPRDGQRGQSPDDPWLSGSRGKVSGADGRDDEEEHQ